MSLRILAVMCASFAMCATSAQAAVILQYATAGSTTSLAPASADAGVAADNLEAGSGLNVQAFSTFNFTGWDTGSTTFAAAVAADDFWTWGFDVTGAGTLDLSTMDIRLDRSGSGPDDFEIHAAINGTSVGALLSFDYNDTSSGIVFADVDISVLGGLVSGDSVVFTLAAFNSESDAGSFDLETITFPGGTDGITINGAFTSAVPEPGSVVLILLGASFASMIGLRSRWS